MNAGSAEIILYAKNYRPRVKASATAGTSFRENEYNVAGGCHGCLTRLLNRYLLAC